MSNGLKLDTGKIDESIASIKTIVAKVPDIKEQIKLINRNLFEDWNGEARNSYEKEFKLLIGNMEDLNESMDEFCKSIETVKDEFVAADQAIANALSNAE